MKDKRKIRGIKNVVYSMSFFSIEILAQFVNRTVFIHMLSVEYLGLNGFFTNLLGVFALAELGIENAVTFSLYKPLSDNNTEIIKSIMALYKKMYYCVGLFVLIVSILFIPFLGFFIKNKPDDIDYIYVYYYIY